MANQITFNRTLLLFLLLVVLITVVITVIAVAQTTSFDFVAKAVEGTGNIYGTIDDNISPWALDAERSIRFWHYRV